MSAMMSGAVPHARDLNSGLISESLTPAHMRVMTEARRLAHAGFAEVRRLAAAGLHAEAQAAQARATAHWMRALGRAANDAAPPPAGWSEGSNAR